MTNLKFEIELSSEDQMPEAIALSAPDETQAVQAVRKYLSTATLPKGTLVFLGFHRASDGQHGYINPDGASPTGKPWNHA